MQRDKGYTLIEILISMFILLLLTSITVFAPKIEQIELKSLAYSMASTLRLAREYNLEGEDYKFFIESQGGEFRYGLRKSGEYLNESIKKVPRDIAIRKNIAPSEDGEATGDYVILNPNINQLEVEIRFTPQAAIGATTIQIEKNRLSTYYVISVVPTSGRVHIYKRNK